MLVALGCWMTAHGDMEMMIARRAARSSFASYLDCCDGEIARIKLQSSTFGAWLDTIVDELSSIGYMVAIGWHCHALLRPATTSATSASIRGSPRSRSASSRIGGRCSASTTTSSSRRLGEQPGLREPVRDRARRRAQRVRITPTPAAASRRANSRSGSRRSSTSSEPRAPRLHRVDRPVYAVLRVPHISFATHMLGGVISSVVVDDRSPAPAPNPTRRRRKRTSSLRARRGSELLDALDDVKAEVGLARRRTPDLEAQRELAELDDELRVGRDRERPRGRAAESSECAFMSVSKSPPP